MSFASRKEMLTPTTAPLPQAQPLGHANVWGPKREEHLVVVLGVGPGLGLCIARVFAAQGYSTAVMSRNQKKLDGYAKELDHIARTARGTPSNSSSPPLSLGFSCDATSSDSIRAAVEKALNAFPGKKLGTAVFNAAVRNRGDFLDQPESHIQKGVAASIFGGFAFMQATLKAIDSHEEGGNVLVTGATSSKRGREGFASFAASKSGLRAMCEAIAKEYGPKQVHVAHVVVDGLIESEQVKELFGFQKGQRFKDGYVLRPEEAAKSWLFLAQQQSSAWTFELDLRPAKEHF